MRRKAWVFLAWFGRTSVAHSSAAPGDAAEETRTTAGEKAAFAPRRKESTVGFRTLSEPGFYT